MTDWIKVHIMDGLGVDGGKKRALASKIEFEKEARFRPVPRFDKCGNPPPPPV